MFLSRFPPQSHPKSWLSSTGDVQDWLTLPTPLSLQGLDLQQGYWEKNNPSRTEKKNKKKTKEF